MPTAPFRPDQLHDPILPHVRPAPLLLHPTETIEQALTRTRELPESRIILYCYVVDTEEFQEVKSHLLATSSLVLRRHSPDDDSNGPVLRRTPQYQSDVGLVSTFVDLPEFN